MPIPNIHLYTQLFLLQKRTATLFFLWQKTVVWSNTCLCVSSKCRWMIRRKSICGVMQGLWKSQGHSVFGLWRGRGIRLLILFDRTHTQWLTSSLIWGLFKFNRDVTFGPLVPKDKDTYAFARPFWKLPLFLLVFYKLAQNSHLQRAVDDPYWIGRMICLSLRKYCLCSSCVCVYDMTSSPSLIVQPSCNQILVHSNEINMSHYLS